RRRRMRMEAVPVRDPQQDDPVREVEVAPERLLLSQLLCIAGDLFGWWQLDRRGSRRKVDPEPPEENAAWIRLEVLAQLGVLGELFEELDRLVVVDADVEPPRLLRIHVGLLSSGGAPEGVWTSRAPRSNGA